METKDQVLKAIKEAKEPLKAGEIAEITGLDKKEVDKAMAKLKKDSLIESPKRCFWQPKS